MKHLFKTMGLTLMGLGTLSGAWAQQDPDTANSMTQEQSDTLNLSEDTQLDEVLIDVVKRNPYLINNIELGGKYGGRLKDLPQSVSVVSAELMQDRQAFTTANATQDLAGVTTASSYDDLIIRGFKSGYDTGTRLVNSMRSAYGHGNSYYRSPLTINLERVEVLKGPGGALFGNIVPGGVINLVTKKPMEEAYGAVRFSTGSFQTLRSSVDLGGALNSDKSILYRLNAGYQYSQTFRDINTQHEFMIAPSFTFKPTEGTQIDVDLVHDQFNGYLDRGMGLEKNDLYALPRSFTLSQPSDFYNSKVFSFAARLAQQILPQLNLHMSYMKSIYQEDVNEHRTLNSYANPPHNTIMNIRFFDRHGKDYTDSFVGYLKWDIQGDRVNHHLIGGIDFSHYKGDKNNQLREARQEMVDGEVTPLTFDMDHPTYTTHDLTHYVWREGVTYPFLSPYNTTGVYLQDQIDFGKKLKAILGLRHERYVSSTISGDSHFSATQNSWLPRLGLTYRLNNKINIFASYAQGFSPVGADLIANYQDYSATKPFSPERSWQVESGIKSSFFHNRLQADLSLFYIERKDMMVTTGDINDAGFPVYRQSGRAVSQGVELDLRGRITDNLSITGNYTYNPTEVKVSSIASEVGQGLPGAPQHMASLWAKYMLLNGPLKGLGFGAGVYYVGGRRMDNSVGQDDNAQALWEEWLSYTTANAAIYYKIGRMDIALNVDNVFDKYYFLGGFDYTRAFPGAPRNLNVSLGYTF